MTISKKKTGYFIKLLDKSMKMRGYFSCLKNFNKF